MTGLDTSKLKQYAPFIVIGVLVLVAFYYFSQSGGATQGTAAVPGTDNSALNAAIVSANAQEAQTNASAAASQFNTEAQLAAAEETAQTQVQLGELSLAATQSSNSAAQSAAEFQTAQGALVGQTQAQMQAYATTTVAKQAATASFWNSLFGTVSTLGGDAISGGLFGAKAAVGGNSATPLTSFAIPAGYGAAGATNVPAVPTLSGLPTYNPNIGYA